MKKTKKTKEINKNKNFKIKHLKCQIYQTKDKDSNGKIQWTQHYNPC